jgi:hypothetical protein
MQLAFTEHNTLIHSHSVAWTKQFSKFVHDHLLDGAHFFIICFINSELEESNNLRKMILSHAFSEKWCDWRFICTPVHFHGGFANYSHQDK